MATTKELTVSQSAIWFRLYTAALSGLLAAPSHRTVMSRIALRSQPMQHSKL